jgi:predicted acetyltransferase
VGFDVTKPVDLDEFDQVFLSIGQYFGAEPNEERAERWSRCLPLDRALAARENGAIVGGAGSFPFSMTVPGATVNCAGVTIVGVYPTHRRRGALTAMMRKQLDDVRERGEPLAALWASEERIYTRYGYGIASLSGETKLLRAHGAYALPLQPDGRVRIVESEEARTLLPPVYDRWRTQSPGAFERTDDWWETRVLDDPVDRRQGRGPKRFAVVERDGEPTAYAIYRHAPKWEQMVSKSVLVVPEAVGADTGALATIWRYLLDVDWTETIEGYLLPVDHPLFLLLAEPRRLRYLVGDGLWVRLVDVGAALSARGYAADGQIVFEVEDAFLPDNTGRWKLEGGTAERTSDEPEIRLDVRDLGSVYLGGFTFTELHRALRIEELKQGAIARADAIFRTDVRPWCPEIF